MLKVTKFRVLFKFAMKLPNTMFVIYDFCKILAV